MAEDANYVVPGSLATAARFQKRYPMLCQDRDAIDIQEILTEATAHIEDVTSRRLAPFTNNIDNIMLNGINPNEYGDDTSGMPLSISGSLGVSYANALGANDLVRNFFLEQCGPLYPELWTYNIRSMSISLTYGNSQPIQLSSLYGPEPNTGYCRLQLGTFAIPGTRLTAVYDGGYTLGIPPSLSRACMFLAAKYIELEGNPQEPASMIDSTIMSLIEPWMRY